MSEAAAARSRVYQVLAAGFGFATEQVFDLIRDGAYERALTESLAALPYEARAVGALVLAEDMDYESFQADYIASFEVGAAGPPCPLYGGIYIGGRNSVWEELIRFYNHFGLHLSKTNRDLPDHLATELEFMHYLSFRESEAESSEALDSLRRAQRDFLERHPVKWLPRLIERVTKKDVPVFYRTLIMLANDVAREDLSYVRVLLASERGQSALVT